MARGSCTNTPANPMISPEAIRKISQRFTCALRSGFGAANPTLPIDFLLHLRDPGPAA